LLRGADRLSRPSGDVDLLVASTGMGKFDAAVTKIGFSSQGWALLVSRRSYVAYSASDELWVRLDVVSQVSFGPLLEFNTVTSEQILKRKIRSGSVVILDPDDAFWHLLLHYMLDKGNVPDVLRPQVSELARAARPTGPLSQVVERLAPNSSRAILLSVQRSAWSEVDRLFVDLRYSWVKSRTPKEQVIVHAHQVLRQLGIAQRSHSSRGMKVTILGPDGAGKTTLALGLRDTLGVPSRYVYNGLWREGRLERLLSHVPGTRLLLLLFRLVARSIRTDYHSWRRRMVLIDRFTYDAYLISSEDGYKQRISAFLLLKLFAKPDLAILLDIPGSVAFSRKGEQSPEIIDVWRDRYLSLKDKLPELVILDATASPQEVLRAATEAIWIALKKTTAI